LYAKAGATDKKEIILKAYEVANEVAEYANNMMTAGRISGFSVKELAKGRKSGLVVSKLDSPSKGRACVRISSTTR
jgi:hypothetical protein